MSAYHYLRLFRISAAVTPAADVTLGFGCALAWGAAEGWRIERLAAACLVSSLIFCSATALNDTLDAAKDALQAPGRPVPSGKLTRRGSLAASALAGIASLAAAAFLGPEALSAAIGVLALTVLYNALARKTRWLGIVNLGLIRVADLFFGMVCAAGFGALESLSFDDRALLPAAYGLYALALSGVALGERSPKPRIAPGVLFSLLALACAAYLAGLALADAPADGTAGVAWLTGACYAALSLPVLVRLLRRPGEAEPLVGHFVSGYLLAAAMPVAAYIGPAAGAVLAALFVLSRTLGRFFPPA